MEIDLFLVVMTHVSFPAESVPRAFSAEGATGRSAPRSAVRNGGGSDQERLLAEKDRDRRRRLVHHPGGRPGMEGRWPLYE